MDKIYSMYKLFIHACSLHIAKRSTAVYILHEINMINNSNIQICTDLYYYWTEINDANFEISCEKLHGETEV